MNDLTPYVSTHFRIIKPLAGYRSIDTTPGKIYKISDWSGNGQFTFIDDIGEYRFWMLEKTKEGSLEDCSFEQNLKKILE